MTDNHAHDKLFFCHIPKTAGLTLRHVLGSHFRHRDIFPYDQWDRVPKDFPPGDLNRCRLFMGHFPFRSMLSLLDAPVTSLTVLRNPVERVLSAYHHIRTHPAHPQHLRLGGTAATLEDFLEKAYPIAYLNAHVAYLSGSFAQKSTLADEREYLRALIKNPAPCLNLSDAKGVLEQIAFVGITERFEESLLLLAHTLGWEPIRSYQSLNISEGRKRAEDVEQALLERLYDYNRLDFELYDYAVQLFDARYRQLIHTLYWEAYNYRRRAQPAAREIEVAFDDAMEGDGWYLREFAPNGQCFRWMGKSGRLFARLLPSQHMEFTAALFHAITPEMLSRLEVKINGYRLNLTWRFEPQQQATILSARFEGKWVETADAVSVIEFSVPQTVSPHTLDERNSDRRELSIAVYRVKVGAAASES